jgi:hypothetical protein
MKKVFSDKVQDYKGSELSDKTNLMIVNSTVFSNSQFERLF